jgi:molybdopterin converting factor small subunit
MPRIQAHGPLTRRIGSDPIQVEGATISEVVGNLDKRFPGFATDVLRPDGSERSSVRFALGDKIVGPLTEVSDGDLIEVITSVAGG